jgi:hypothetical protein
MGRKIVRWELRIDGVTLLIIVGLTVVGIMMVANSIWG